MSYANEDAYFVEDYLIPRLKELGFGLCNPKVHFLAGQTVGLNINQSIMKSKRIIVFYSQSYSQSDRCEHEFRMALSVQCESMARRLITITDTDVNVNEQHINMKKYFRKFKYIKRESQLFWENLQYYLPVNPKHPPTRENIRTRDEQGIVGRGIEMDMRAENGQGDIDQENMLGVDAEREGIVDGVDRVVPINDEVDQRPGNMNLIEVIALVHNEQVDETAVEMANIGDGELDADDTFDLVENETEV